MAWIQANRRRRDWLAQHGDPYHGVSIVDRDGRVGIDIGV